MMHGLDRLRAWLQLVVLHRPEIDAGTNGCYTGHYDRSFGIPTGTVPMTAFPSPVLAVPTHGSESTYDTDRPKPTAHDALERASSFC
jgi:hypothetical protein